MSTCILHILKHGISVIDVFVLYNNISEHQRVLRELGYTSYVTDIN